MAFRVVRDSEDNGNELVSCNIQGLIVSLYNSVVTKDNFSFHNLCDLLFLLVAFFGIHIVPFPM